MPLTVNTGLNDAQSHNESARSTHIYKDLNLFFTKHPLTADVSKVTDVQAIKRSVRNLVLTNRGERFFQPQLGTSLRNFLFEQFTEDTLIGIQNEIVEVFKSWLPFVEIKDLRIDMNDVDDISGKNKLNIDIVFFIKQNPNMLDSVQVEII